MTLYIYDFIHFCCLFLNLLKTFIVSLIWSFYFELRLWLVTLHGKWSFPLKIFLVNLNKHTGNCGLNKHTWKLEQTHLETWTNTLGNCGFTKELLNGKPHILSRQQNREKSPMQERNCWRTAREVELFEGLYIWDHCPK